MIKIEKRSNKTRAVERPPLTIQPVSATLHAEIDRIAVKRAAKPAGSSQTPKPEQPRKAQPQRPDTTQAPGKPASSAPSVKPPEPYLRSSRLQSPQNNGRNGYSPNSPNNKPFMGRDRLSGAQTPSKSQENGIEPKKEQPQSADSKGEASKRPTEKSSAPNGTGPKAPDITPPGTNGNGAHSTSDTRLPPTNGVKPNTSLNRTFNTNGSNNNAIRRPSLFNSNGYTSTPPVRTTPKPNGPVQMPLDPPQPAQDPPQNGQNGRNSSPSNGKPPSLPENSSRSEVSSGAESVRASERSTAPRNQRSEITQDLEKLIRQQNDLPDQTALLGVCEDGLPVLLDLNDPTPGAVLAIGDERQALLEMLHTAVATIATRNSPRKVQFLVLSCEPQSWRDWVTKHGFDRHSIAIESAEDDVVREWILRLADWTEQRRLGQRSGPVVLLIMDTLSFLPRLEYDVRLNFEWMAKEGPQAQIWPLAAISTELAKALSARRLLRAFQTRILGYAEHPQDYEQLVQLSEESAADFAVPGQFAVQVGEGWLRFRLLGDL